MSHSPMWVAAPGSFLALFYSTQNSPDLAGAKSRSGHISTPQQDLLLQELQKASESAHELKTRIELVMLYSKFIQTVAAQEITLTAQARERIKRALVQVAQFFHGSEDLQLSNLILFLMKENQKIIEQVQDLDQVKSIIFGAVKNPKKSNHEALALDFFAVLPVLVQHDENLQAIVLENFTDKQGSTLDSTVKLVVSLCNCSTSFQGKVFQKLWEINPLDLGCMELQDYYPVLLCESAINFEEVNRVFSWLFGYFEQKLTIKSAGIIFPKICGLINKFPLFDTSIQMEKMCKVFTMDTRTEVKCIILDAISRIDFSLILYDSNVLFEYLDDLKQPNSPVAKKSLNLLIKLSQYHVLPETLVTSNYKSSTYTMAFIRILYNQCQLDNEKIGQFFQKIIEILYFFLTSNDEDNIKIVSRCIYYIRQLCFEDVSVGSTYALKLVNFFVEILLSEDTDCLLLTNSRYMKMIEEIVVLLSHLAVFVGGLGLLESVRIRLEGKSFYLIDNFCSSVKRTNDTDVTKKQKNSMPPSLKLVLAVYVATLRLSPCQKILQLWQQHHHGSLLNHNWLVYCLLRETYIHGYQHQLYHSILPHHLADQCETEESIFFIQSVFSKENQELTSLTGFTQCFDRLFSSLHSHCRQLEVRNSFAKKQWYQYMVAFADLASGFKEICGKCFLSINVSTLDLVYVRGYLRYSLLLAQLIRVLFFISDEVSLSFIDNDLLNHIQSQYEQECFTFENHFAVVELHTICEKVEQNLKRYKQEEKNFLSQMEIFNSTLKDINIKSQIAVPRSAFKNQEETHHSRIDLSLLTLKFRQEDTIPGRYQIIWQLKQDVICTTSTPNVVFSRPNSVLSLNSLSTSSSKKKKFKMIGLQQNQDLVCTLSGIIRCCSGLCLLIKLRVQIYLEVNLSSSSNSDDMKRKLKKRVLISESIVRPITLSGEQCFEVQQGIELSATELHQHLESTSRCSLQTHLTFIDAYQRQWRYDDIPSLEKHIITY